MRLQVGFFCALLLTACGGGTPQVAAPSPSVAAGSVPVSAPSPSPGSKEAELPSTVQPVARIRLLHPERTLRRAASLLARHVPMHLVDPRRTAELAVGPTVAGLMAFDRPLEIVLLTIDPPVLVAIGEVRHGVKARAELERALRVVETQGGQLRVEPRGAFAGGLGLAKECEVVKGEGVDEIACGSAKGSVARLRAAPPGARSAGREVVAELDLESLKPQMMKALESSSNASKAGAEDRGEDYRAGAEVGDAAVRELVEDLRSLVVEANLSDDTLDVALTLRMRQGQTMVSRLLGSTKRPAPPPASFFHLPVESDAAFFTAGVDAATWDPIKKKLLDALVGSIARDTEYPDALLGELREAAGDLFMTGGPWMLAAGHDWAGLRQSLAGGPFGKLKNHDEREVAGERALKTWVILEADEPGDRFVAKINRLMDIDARARRVAKPRRPPKTPGSATGADKNRTVGRTQFAAVPAGFPSGSIHLVTRSVRRDQPKNEKLAETTHVFVLPEKDHVWVAIGGDEKTLRERVGQVLEGAPDSRTLAARSDADVLRKGSPLTGGGMWGLNALLGIDVASVATADVKAAEARIAYAGTRSSKGNAPYYLSVRREVDGDPAVTIQMSTTRAAFEDLVGWFELIATK